MDILKEKVKEVTESKTETREKSRIKRTIQSVRDELVKLERKISENELLGTRGNLSIENGAEHMTRQLQVAREIIKESWWEIAHMTKR